MLQYFSSTPGTSIQEKIKNITPATLLLADGSVYPAKGTIELASGLISTETGTATFKATYTKSFWDFAKWGECHCKSDHNY